MNDTNETNDINDNNEIGNATRDLGPQPIAELMMQLNLKPHDLVEASTEQLTVHPGLPWVKI